MHRIPTISVVMSVHNHEAYVRQAVESVLAQTFGDWELILLNNGSTDESPRIIDQLAKRDARIRAFHQPNLGLPASRNRGIGLARAAWIAYLDSDDVWFPHTLAHYAGAVEATPSARFVFGYAHRLCGDTITELRGVHQDRAVGTRELFQRMFLTPLTVCHRRELWRQAGSFDPQLVWCDDYDLFLRMSLLCRFEPLGQLLGLRRRHDRNLSAPSGASYQAEAEVLRRFAAGQGRDALDERLIARRLAQMYGRAARRYLRERNYPRASMLAQEAVAYAPTWRYRMLCRFCAWLNPCDRARRTFEHAC
jgi:hypothetical protein